jgi:hypothetical protein
MTARKQFVISESPPAASLRAKRGNLFVTQNKLSCFLRLA